MKLNDFKRLLAVPTKSNREHQMVEYLVNWCMDRTGVHVQVDQYSNVYVVKRNSDKPLPCVAAHIDSVQPLRDVEVIVDGDIVTGAWRMRRVGLGADNKTGVQVCLDLLDRLDHVAAAFFAGEEIGCVGSSNVDPDFMRLVGYMVEFDCPSRNMMSYTSGGVRLFDNQGEFIRKALPVLKKHGTALWQRHPYTDVKAIRRRYPISCLNLSSGYYNWHADDEFLKLSEVEMATELGAELIQELNGNHYPCTLQLNEDAPLIEVGNLLVPEP